MAFGVIRNVRKVFQVDELGSTALEPVVALDDASFQFEQGDLVALLGPADAERPRCCASSAG